MMELRDDGYWYSIQGINPEPWEAPEGSVIRKNGFHVHMHSPERLTFYEESVAEEFVLQNPGFVNLGETELTVNFYLWRTVTGKNVDATNCQKALEDALQGVLYSNDTNNRWVSTWLEQDETLDPFILINVNFDTDLTRNIYNLKRKLTPAAIRSASNVLDGRDIF